MGKRTFRITEVHEVVAENEQDAYDLHGLGESEYMDSDIEDITDEVAAEAEAIPAQPEVPASPE